MAKKPKESAHAAKLRESGFEPISKELRRILPRSIRRAQEAKLRKDGGVKPYFTASDIVTYAKDETGITWMKAGRVDLTPLGFEDHSSVFEDYLKVRNQTDPKFN